MYVNFAFSDTKFSSAGREDVDVRMLGKGKQVLAASRLTVPADAGDKITVANKG